MGSFLSSPPKNETNLSGKVIVITGASRGIGLETAKQFYKLGATVYLGVRTEEKGNKAIREIQADVTQSVGQLKWFPLDLSTLKGSQESAEGVLKMIHQLDILVNNAAIGGDPFGLNADGIETTMAVNHFGHFVFTLAVLDLMKQTSKQSGADVRIVTLSSIAHTWAKDVSFEQPSDLTQAYPAENTDTWTNSLARYGRSKLANILFMKELQRRLGEDGYDIILTSVHPGSVRTVSAINITSQIPVVGSAVGFLANYMFATLPDGAYTSVFAAINPAVRAQPEDYKGKYLVPMGKVAAPGPLGEDVELGKKLWALTERVVAAGGIA
ncbi:NAD-P-binding protein [Ceratobasidium sp. AG-I]|nr:NAD-P-binding protein [Ceratobasidium sp. AG-I]